MGLKCMLETGMVVLFSLCRIRSEGYSFRKRSWAAAEQSWRIYHLHCHCKKSAGQPGEFTSYNQLYHQKRSATNCTMQTHARNMFLSQTLYFLNYKILNLEDNNQSWKWNLLRLCRLRARSKWTSRSKGHQCNPSECCCVMDTFVKAGGYIHTGL